MDDFINRFVDRLRGEYPDSVAILLKGSHARGEAHPWSDVDFDVLVAPNDVEAYRAWIEPVGDRLVHISAAVESADAWEADAAEPSSWSLGFPTVETTKLLWAADEASGARFDHPYKQHPAAEPEIEDTMEALGKIRSALDRGDETGVYRNANKLATLIPTLLIPLNPSRSVSHSRQAITAVCELPNAPAGFAEDWLYCMGYVDARTAAEIATVAARLFLGVLDMLPADAAIIDKDFARMLADGTLRAYLAQNHAS